jgi:hypothetical protein
VRLDKNKTIDARKKQKNKFIAAANVAKRRKLFLLVKIRNGAAYARVSQFRRKKHNKVNIKLTWLYRLSSNKKKISSSNTRKFVKHAYIKTMDGFFNEFKKQANKRLNK